MKILLTGVTGFLGKYFYNTFPEHVLHVIGRQDPSLGFSNNYFKLDINKDTDFLSALIGIEIVVHCAARVHMMDDLALNPLESFRAINTNGTLNLAKQAADLGVKRFVFISSIKVNGESTLPEKAFTADDVHHPQDPYAISKSEAECQLLALGQKTGMEVVIIRPPLVYGPGVKANFASLLNLASKGLPLPFACFNNNKRSMVSVDNLVDLIITCIEHPKAANQVFLVSDDDDLSTTDIIKKLSRACGNSGFMLPIPVVLFKLIAILIGKQDFIDRLSASLRVDISKTKELLDWIPPQSVNDGFKKTAEAFLKSKKQ
jgi:UDP-glucose 4-epimerase